MHRRIPLLTLSALLVVVSFRASAAQVQWGLTAWSVGLGLVDPENIDSTFWLDGGAEFARVNPNLTLDGRLMYWSSSNGSGDLKVDVSDIAILPGATYRFTSQPSFTPFARGGIGIHRLKADVKTDLGPLGIYSASATDTKFGIYFGGGAAFRPSDRFELLGLVEIHIMDTNFVEIGAEARVPIGM
jgi:Outer membrane protein beta-barrel domain